MQGRSEHRVSDHHGRRELALFGAVYAMYDAGRRLFAGQVSLARETHVDPCSDPADVRHVLTT